MHLPSSITPSISERLAADKKVVDKPSSKLSVFTQVMGGKRLECQYCLVPRRLSFDENVRAKEGGKETTGETSGRSCFQDGGKSNGGRICSF